MAAARATTKKKRKPAKKLEQLSPSGSVWKYGTCAARVNGDTLELSFITTGRTWNYADYEFRKKSFLDGYQVVTAAAKEAGWIK